MATQIRAIGNIGWPLTHQLDRAVSDALNAGEKEFVIGLNSGGGNVQLGLGTYNLLKTCGAKVTTHNLGHVDSVAGLIYSAGHQRLALSHSRFLIHDITWGLDRGSYHETALAEALQQVRTDRAILASALSEALGVTPSEAEAMMKSGTVLSATEAVSSGLVHSISDLPFDWSKGVIEIHNEMP